MANDKNFGDNLISAMKKSATDLEKFQVQLALGKAEARDKFEEVKKKFNAVVASAKQKVTAGKQKAQDIHGDFDELRVQLALGKAETIEAFNEQKKKILRAISVLEKRISSGAFAHEVEEKLRHEIEKFKIKLEVLRVHFELGKMEARDEFEAEKKELSMALAKWKAKFQAKKNTATKTRNARSEELKEAYKHLKKALVG